MENDDPRRYLGRGFEPIGGKPFGYAFVMEQRAIRDHLKARGRWHDARDDFRVSAIQRRLNREHPKRWKARIDAWKAQQPKPTGGEAFLTYEEAERLVDLFTGANDPITASIAVKAAAILESRDE